MKNLHRLSALFTLCASLGITAQAQSLAELFKSARDFDANYQAAKLLYEANLSKAEQSKALELPTVNLALGVNRLNVASDVANFDRGTYGNQNATVSASVPLYRLFNKASAEQGKKSVASAKALLTVAEQTLIVQVSQAYFDVLASQDSLGFVQAQKTAVAEQLASAKRNFEVGTATITDTREAQARFDLVLAQEIAAENDLRVKKIALDQLTGVSAANPKPGPGNISISAVTPNEVSHWVNQSETAHPSIVQAQTALELAKLEIEKAQSGNKPTLDLTSSYAITQNNGSNNTTLDYRTQVASIGLVFNLPLYNGESTQNRIKETIALEDQARANVESAKRAVAQATRTAFYGVQSGLGQVRALEAAQASSQSALDATKLGYQVGVRVNVDVLNAQSLLFDTKARLAKARYDVLLGGLKLRQANGSLNGDDLQAVSRLLAP